MKVKRLVISALVAGSLLGTMAGGVGAAAPQGGNANCVGQAAPFLNQIGQEFFGVNGLGGQTVSEVARAQGGLGQIASSNCTDG